MGPVRNALIAAAVLAVLAGCTRERPGLPPQHVLLVTVENLRADRTSFLMHDRPTTLVPGVPRERHEGRAFGIDDLAATGVSFASCYAPSPITEVSLASLMTGRPPLEHGVVAIDERLPGQLVTLGEVFRANGFSTAAFLSGSPGPDGSLAQGFEVLETHPADLSALRAASRWLSRDPGAGERTFVWIHLAALALPWSPRRPVHEAEEALAERVFVDPEYVGPAEGSLAFVDAVNDGTLRLDDADRAAVDALYDREVAAMTALLWTGLQETYDFHTAAGEATETWPRTVFVLAGVQGLELCEHGGIGAAGTLSEATLHVPLVLRHPDSLTGERILDEVVELADVMPTLLDWFRLPTPAGVRGRSLLARMDSYVKRPFEHRPVFAQLPERGVFSARTPRWHLVWNALRAQPAGRPAASPPLPAVALYEPALDPDEVEDVSARHPEVVAALTAAIRAWREAQVLFPSELRPQPR